MRELRECYSLEDLFNIWETVYTEKYNEWQARVRQEQHRKMLKGR